MESHQNNFSFPQSVLPEPALLPASHPPVLIVVVDTEEEFDWSRPFSRSSTSTESLNNLHLLQDLMDSFDVQPVYVIDYPIVEHRASENPLLEFQRDRGAEIGLHLHPWVSPPHAESVNTINSFASNLPMDLERKKIQTLAKRMTESLGFQPQVYKAGRYGIGPNTPQVLEEEGFLVDLSPCAAFDFSGEGGPDFSATPPDPVWFGVSRDLLSIPASGAVVGPLGYYGERLFWAAENGSLLTNRLTGLLSRLRIVDRLHLSPEGYTSTDHFRLTRFLFNRGIRVFTFSLHSPSLLPGCTPYVKTAKQLQELLESCRRYLDFFLNELKGIAMTATALRERVLKISPRRQCE